MIGLKNIQTATGAFQKIGDERQVFEMLDHNEKICLKNMMSLYYVVIMSNEDRSNDEARAVACGIIKEFLGYCFLKGHIGDDDFSYIRTMDIVSSKAGHKAFYDIITRKYL